MRLVVQRVARAAVRVDGALIGSIERGALVLVGVSAGDTPEIADRMGDKLVGLRYFEDAAGRANLDLSDVGGSVLAVSQFTLTADLRRGRRPGFTNAAAPAVAEGLFARFVRRVEAAGVTVATGRFGAKMEVELVNDGPFTLVVDSGIDIRHGDVVVRD